MPHAVDAYAEDLRLRGSQPRPIIENLEPNEIATHDQAHHDGLGAGMTQRIVESLLRNPVQVIGGSITETKRRTAHLLKVNVTPAKLRVTCNQRSQRCAQPAAAVAVARGRAQSSGRL